MSQSCNQHGDQFKPTNEGHGVDVSSQRGDDLDAGSLNYIRTMAATGRRVTALDLGGGYGAHSVRMAEAGVVVTMVDIGDMASSTFAAAIVQKSLSPDTLRTL